MKAQMTIGDVRSVGVWYVLQGQQGQVKGGFTTNPGRRIKALQTGNPDSLKLLVLYTGVTYVDDRCLKKLLRPFLVNPLRTRSEWYWDGAGFWQALNRYATQMQLGKIAVGYEQLQLFEEPSAKD